jgi:hypothetical protein
VSTPLDSDTVTITRVQLRRALVNMGLTVTGSGQGDQVFDWLVHTADPAVQAGRALRGIQFGDGNQQHNQF